MDVHSGADDNAFLFENCLDTALEHEITTALPYTPSTEHDDNGRDEARNSSPLEHHAKTLALSLANRIKARLGHIWQRVSFNAAAWIPVSEKNDRFCRTWHELHSIW